MKPKLWGNVWIYETQITVKISLFFKFTLLSSLGLSSLYCDK